MEMEESVSEEAHSRRVGVFRWNEKLSMDNAIQDCFALFICRITTKFISSSSNAQEEEIRPFVEIQKFHRIWLLADKYITSLIVDVLKTTEQFLPTTIASLAPEISNYIISRFRFSPPNLLLRNQPRVVIVVDIDRTQTSSTTATGDPPPPREEEESPVNDEVDRENIVASDEEEDQDCPWEEDPELLQIMCSLSETVVSDGEVKQPREPIATDELVGLFEVDPKSEHMWVRRTNEEEEAEEVVVGECAICLDVVSTERYPIHMVETPCLHVFHKRCLSRWKSKSKSSSCPTCRRPLS